jgi:hypothetical protein
MLKTDEPILVATEVHQGLTIKYKKKGGVEIKSGHEQKADMSDLSHGRKKNETDQFVLLELPPFPPMSFLNFSGSSFMTFMKCHSLNHPTFFSIKWLPMALIVSFFKSPILLLGCKKVQLFLVHSLPFACKVDTHQLSHTVGEDVGGLHVGLAEEKHSHVHNASIGGIGGHGMTRLLQALVCWSLRVAIRGHGRIALSTSVITTRILVLGGARGTVSLGVVCTKVIAGEGALCVFYRVDVVFRNGAPANDDGRICGLRDVNLINENLHDLQHFGQGPGVEFSDWVPSSDDVDVAEVLQEVSEQVEDSLDIDVQVPMETWHIFSPFLANQLTQSLLLTNFEL